MENVKKIAVLRANALGDFIVTLPALYAIRATYPNAEIVLLGKPWHKEFLVQGRTPVDRVIVVPVKKGIREDGVPENERELAAFFEAMQEERFDIAMHLQGNGISANPFIKHIGARLTVGIACEAAEPLDRSIDFYYYQSEVIRYLEVASLIGAGITSIEPHIEVLQHDIIAIKNLMQRITKPYVVLHPYAVDIRRMWPIENYAPLADALHEQGFQIVFSGSQQDKAGVDTIIDSMQYEALNTCGEIELGGLCALLANAAFVIGADTGPMHLARAVNAKTIGIYWAPNLINWGPLTRGLHKPLISWRMACPLCGVIPNKPYPFEPQIACKHLVSFVADITIDEVLHNAIAMLKQKQVSNRKEKIYNDY